MLFCITEPANPPVKAQVVKIADLQATWPWQLQFHTAITAWLSSDKPITGQPKLNFTELTHAIGFFNFFLSIWEHETPFHRSWVV